MNIKILTLNMELQSNHARNGTFCKNNPLQNGFLMASITLHFKPKLTHMSSKIGLI
jgi:hypothetical protein